MQPFFEPNESSPWNAIEPLLDEAMAALGDKDRNLVLLRYFENKSLKEVGEVFDITEDAAQKRVARAVDKLRSHLGRRGIAVSGRAWQRLSPPAPHSLHRQR